MRISLEPPNASIAIGQCVGASHVSMRCAAYFCIAACRRCTARRTHQIQPRGRQDAIARSAATRWRCRWQGTIADESNHDAATARASKSHLISSGDFLRPGTGIIAVICRTRSVQPPQRRQVFIVICYRRRLIFNPRALAWRVSSTCHRATVIISVVVVVYFVAHLCVRRTRVRGLLEAARLRFGRYLPAQGRVSIRCRRRLCHGRRRRRRSFIRV